MLYGVLALKIISARFGLDVLGEVGQVLSIMSITLVFAIAGGGRLLTHEHAASDADKSELLESNYASYLVAFGASSVIAIVLLISRGVLATVIVGSEETTLIFVLMATVVPLYAMNGLGTAISAAYGHGTRIAVAMALSSATGLLLLWFSSTDSLAPNLAVLIMQGPINFVFLWFASLRSLRRSEMLGVRPRSSVAPEWRVLKRLMSYATVMVIPVFLQQTQRIINRAIISSELNDSAVGRWEAVIKLQEGSIQLIGSLLILLFLPRFVLSPTKAVSEARQFSVQVSAVFLLAAGVLALWGDHVLSLLYSAEASSASQSLAVNTLSDAARALYTTFQVVYLARERFAAFITLELVAASMLVLATLVGSVGSLERIFYLYAGQGLIMSAISLSWFSLSRRRDSWGASIERMKVAAE